MKDIKEESNHPFNDIRIIEIFKNNTLTSTFLSNKTQWLSINPVAEHWIVKYFIFLIVKPISTFQDKLKYLAV